MFNSIFKPAVLAAALVTASATSSATSSATDLSSSSIKQGGQTGTCRDVRLGQVAWTDLQVVTAIADTLLDSLGYQSQVHNMPSLADVYQAMSDDQLDVFMGYWQPSQQSMAEPYIQQGDFHPVATNLDEARMTLAVPSYVYDQGVRSLQDLACSGLLIPDTQIGGNLATREVFNEKTTSFLYPRVQI